MQPYDNYYADADRQNNSAQKASVSRVSAKKGIDLRFDIVAPKKPNSAKRKIAKVRLKQKSGHSDSWHIFQDKVIAYRNYPKYWYVVDGCQIARASGITYTEKRKILSCLKP